MGHRGSTARARFPTHQRVHGGRVGVRVRHQQRVEHGRRHLWNPQGNRRHGSKGHPRLQSLVRRRGVAVWACMAIELVAGGSKGVC